MVAVYTEGWKRKDEDGFKTMVRGRAYIYTGARCLLVFSDCPHRTGKHSEPAVKPSPSPGLKCHHVQSMTILTCLVLPVLLSSRATTSYINAAARGLIVCPRTAPDHQKRGTDLFNSW
jgi:hypothetical protein